MSLERLNDAVERGIRAWCNSTIMLGVVQPFHFLWSKSLCSVFIAKTFKTPPHWLSDQIRLAAFHPGSGKKMSSENSVPVRYSRASYISGVVGLLFTFGLGFLVGGASSGSVSEPMNPCSDAAPVETMGDTPAPVEATEGGILTAADPVLLPSAGATVEAAPTAQ